MESTHAGARDALWEFLRKLRKQVCVTDNCEKQYYYLGYLPYPVRVVSPPPPQATVSIMFGYSWWDW